MITYNQQPYFDDFDKSKNFTQVLFKPSKAVQVRELNTLQSIQQNQLEQFANHIFKHGAKVDGAAPTRTNTRYVTFDAKSPWNNANLNLANLNEDRLIGVTSGVEAELFFIAPTISTDPPTIYVNYTKAGTDNKQTEFLDGEVINVVDSNGVTVYSAKVRCLECPGSNDTYTTVEPTGMGSLWQIPLSTFYVYGSFIEIAPTTIIGEKYSTDAESYKIGLDIVSDIVTADSDPSLYDNALGYPNYSADGADRARTYLVPVVRTLNSDDGDSFVVLAKVSFGTIQFLLTKTEYADLMDTLAERTYDESGNYTVIPFTAKYREHLKTSESDSNGRYLAEEGGDESKLIATLSSGKGYIKGYQVEKISEFDVEIEKARDTSTFRNYSGQFGNISYIRAKLETNSALCSSDSSLESVFTNDSVEIWNGLFSGGTPLGSQIGTLKIYDVIKESGTGADTIYKFFITDVSMIGANGFGTARTLYSTNSAPFLATLVDAVIHDGSKKALIWEIGKPYIKSTYDIDNPTQKSLGFVKRKKLNGFLDGSGEITFTAESGEIFISSDFNTTLASVSGLLNGAAVPILLSSTNCTITPSTISIDLNGSYPGYNITVFQNVSVSVGTEKKKTLVSKTSGAGESGPLLDGGSAYYFNIPYSDLRTVEKVYRYATATPGTLIDVTDVFSWTTGQADHGYVQAKFTTAKTTDSDLWETSADEFIVEFTYFEHGAGDFFSVDSYADIIDDPSINFSYGDIPTYRASNGNIYNLRDCLDFRPLLITDAEIEVSQPASWSVISTDLTYYLPRTDFLVVNKDGTVFQKKGTSSATPRPPLLDESGAEMALFEIIMKPYVFNIQSDIISKKVENKRYTMRDIGRIESRIDRLEETITLSLLETSADTWSIKDENGLDRFKNGFVVDNFANFQAAEIGSNEFRASINSGSKFLKPRITTFSSKLLLDPSTSSNIKAYGNVIMADFNEELYFDQPYSSKTMSVNPYFIFNKIGTMVLTPNMDSWTNVTHTTPIVINTEQFFARTEDTRFNFNSANPFVDEASILAWLQIRDPANWDRSTVETNSIEQSFETRTSEAVTNVSLNPYMRAATVIFYASGLMANTRVYPFFDKVAVSQYCYPAIPNAKPGDSIVTSSTGMVVGVFQLPNNVFFAGEKTLRLTNVADDSRDEDELRTSAEQLFYSMGMNVEKQRTTHNIRTQTSVRSLRDEFTFSPEISVAQENLNRGDPWWGQSDPIAQTFTAVKDMFVTSIEVYFQSAQPQVKLFMQIKDTVNGYPGPNILGQQNFLGSSVNVSENASVPTKITFPVPVFLTGGKDYAFIVGGDSPEAFMWVCKLGERDTTNPNILIDKQPTLGSLFKSQNNSTWTASQNEDVKFKINVAKFKNKTTVIGMRNEILKDQYSTFNAFETEDGSDRVRVHSPNHGMVVGDKTSFDLGNESWIDFNQTSGVLNIGHNIVTATGSGEVKNIKSTSTPNRVSVQLNNLKGYFLTTQAFTAAAFTPTVPNTALVESLLGPQPAPKLVNAVVGTVHTTFNPDVNGIPFGELNKTLTVVAVDSIDSFVVTAAVAATETGFGGGYSTLNCNKRFDSFCVTGNVASVSCDASWKFSATQHSQNGIFTNNDYVKTNQKNMALGGFLYNGIPYKIASEINETIRFGGTSRSFTPVATFTASTDYVSPVLDMDSFCMVGSANVVDFNTQAIVAVEPNSASRWVAETDPEEGIATYKYVTKDIELETPAYDLKILLDVYKQTHADFDIYIKTQPAEASTPLNEIAWTLITTNKDFTSKNLTDYREVEVDSSGIQKSFSAFKVKIVGRTKNTANPPLFKNFRAIAVT